MPEIKPPEEWSCPLPMRPGERVVMGHGGGGILSAELIEQVIVPAFGGAPEGGMRDSALLDVPAELADGGRLAFSTDSYVVSPLFFPGGSIGDLAVHGTINDLAMSGARPLMLSCGLILEEGLELDTLARVARDMGQAAHAAGVPIGTGDTKVVGQGHADGLYVNTAGIGVVPAGVDIGPVRACPGDVVIVSGPIGEHGVTILSQRDGLEFGTTLKTDSAPLHRMVAGLLAAGVDVHVLRDPTRGGVAASLTEIAADSKVGIVLDEASVPVPDAVAAACGFLGLDPLHVANEGKLVAVVAPDDVDAALAAIAADPAGRGAAVIGTVTDAHPGILVGRTRLGARRVIDRPLGEQLPRIC